MPEGSVDPAAEPLAHRRKRLYMRSIRRGIKEMDLILTTYADAQLAGMEEEALALYDQFLSENDHDLYQWVTGQSAAPERYETMVLEIQKLIHP